MNDLGFARQPMSVVAPLLRGKLGETPRSKLRAKAANAASPELEHGTSGQASGGNCQKPADLRSLVDTYLATPDPDFPGLGSTVPGVSVSWSAPRCDTFNYAAGLSNVEKNLRMTSATLMGIASMTKAVMAAITLRLSESGTFGPQGLGTPVSSLLTARQIEALTVGDDPSRPRCPGHTYLYDRETGQTRWTAFSCPDLSQVTLRDLMRANHGMYDILDEVLLPDGDSQYDQSIFFELYRYFGLKAKRPVSSTSGFDYLKSYGLKRDNSAVIGGSSVRDFETSFGNTGYQLLGIILEKSTGKSLDELIRSLIVAPLGLSTIELYDKPAHRGNLIADGYEIVTGDPEFEQTGVYPLADLHGQTAVNTLSLGLGYPGNINLAGGAGGLIANPKSYQVFMKALLTGGLLGPAAQRELDNSYVLIPELSYPQYAFLNGFGLVKQKLRGYPGYPDVDWFEHDGSLPGVLCTNGVLFAPDSNVFLGAGVMCENANRNAYPPLFSLFDEFLTEMIPPTAHN
jgi:CubicO group peptidase (beta-lactamase class C family)